MLYSVVEIRNEFGVGMIISKKNRNTVSKKAMMRVINDYDDDDN